MSTGQRFVMPDTFDVNAVGAPYIGGQLFFYASGTTTPLATYQDQALTIPNSNPVIADSTGHFGNIFLQALPYKVALEDTNGVPIWTFDPVEGIPSISSAMAPVVAATTVGAAFNELAAGGGTVGGNLAVDGTVVAAGAIGGASLTATGGISGGAGGNFVGEVVCGSFATTGLAIGVTRSPADTTSAFATTAFVNPASVVANPGSRTNPDGTIDKWGSFAGAVGTAGTVSFAVQFPTTCVHVDIVFSVPGGGTSSAIIRRSAPSVTGFAFYWDSWSGTGAGNSTTISWRAIGY